MDIQSEKIRLIEWLIGVQDLSVLQKLAAVKNESKQESQILIATTKGQPLSKSDYIDEVKSAEVQIENGQSMSQKAVKKAINQW